MEHFARLEYEDKGACLINDHGVSIVAEGISGWRVTAAVTDALMNCEYRKSKHTSSYKIRPYERLSLQYFSLMQW